VARQGLIIKEEQVDESQTVGQTDL
jgi:hypothetical protein